MRARPHAVARVEAAAAANVHGVAEALREPPPRRGFGMLSAWWSGVWLGMGRDVCTMYVYTYMYVYGSVSQNLPFPMQQIARALYGGAAMGSSRRQRCHCASARCGHHAMLSMYVYCVTPWTHTDARTPRPRATNALSRMKLRCLITMRRTTQSLVALCAEKTIRGRCALK